MSDDAPRWPDAAGGPGVDLSPLAAPAGQQAEDAVELTGPSAPGAGAAEASAVGPEMAPPFDPKDAAAAWAWQPSASRTGSSADDAAPADVSAAIAGAAAAAAERTRREAETIHVQQGARPAGPSVGSVPGPRRQGPRRTRKARLRLSRIDPWSVMKTAFLFSIAFGIIVMAVAWVLWGVVSASGVIESLNSFMATLIGDQDGARFDIGDWINGPRVLGFTALVAAIDVVILTAVATLFAFLYNLAATVIGGLEVTLAED